MKPEKSQAVPNRILFPHLSEAEQTLEAIRMGEVDALVVDGTLGPQIYSLEGPDRPFRTLVEHMRQGAVALDTEETILYSNAFFAELLKAPLETIIGARLTSFLHAKDLDLYRTLRKDCATGHVRGAVHLLALDGEEVLVQLSLNPLPGSPPPTCCVVVSDLREQEKARKEQVAREAAEAANVAKDQFLALLSHELRAPLHSILGWAQILKRMGFSDPDLKRGIDTIERNARAQAHLVSDLLDMSRITSGKLHLEKTVVDIYEVVDSAMASIAPSAEGRTIRYENALEPAPVKVLADPARLQQIVWNLLTNALKYTPPNGEIRVTTRLQDSSVEIEVADTGQGMSAEFLPRLFQPFQQAETATNRKTGGLGLGMPIVKELVDLHGGSVSARSDGEGLGSTFTVRLPLAERDASDVPSTTISKARDPRSLEGIQVLVVDDDSDAREVLKRGLAAHGAEVLLASGTEEALRIVETARPNVLVGDIAMPGGDGYELIRALRARGFGARELPAVAVSAFAGPEDRRRALTAGYQAHMPKPVDASELSAIASSLIGGGES